MRPHHKLVIGFLQGSKIREVPRFPFLVENGRNYWYVKLSRTLTRVAPRAGSQLAAIAKTVMMTNQYKAPAGV